MEAVELRGAAVTGTDLTVAGGGSGPTEMQKAKTREAKIIFSLEVNK